jgi:putative ABC transport system permease protein
MVDRHFGGESPIGRQFRQGASDTLPAITIVGVVPDLDFLGARSVFDPDFEPSGYYVPLRQHDTQFVSVAAQARSGEAGGLANVVRTVVRGVDPDVPIYYPFTQAEVIDRANWFFSVFGAIFIAFGVAALFMASVGLYGVLAFAVSRRTQEMGIRVALGAQAHQVVALVVRQGVGHLALGLGIGLALAFGLTRLIRVLMYQVDPQDPAVLGAVVAVIGAVGAGAAFFPARRATKLTPVDALRSR